MNIIYTLNNKFVPQVGASIISVCENNKSIDDITFYIISKEITEHNKEKLKKIVQKYNRKLIIKELGDVKKYFDFEFNTTGWNSIVLARLILDKFLPENIDKILYLDGDTIVRGSLKELWNTDINNYVLGASIEPTVDKTRKKNLGLESKPYYNAGVLLVNLKKWREINAGKIILEYYKNHNGQLFANDQDAINGCLVDNIYTLLPKYNFYNIFYQYPYSFLKKLMKPCEYIDKEKFDECIKNPVIIHYLGEERPWREGNHHKYKNDYQKYLNQTPWQNSDIEKGWKLYFSCWYVFNFITKPFPRLRYTIINLLIPMFIKIRSKQLKNNLMKRRKR